LGTGTEGFKAKLWDGGCQVKSSRASALLFLSHNQKLLPVNNTDPKLYTKRFFPSCHSYTDNAGIAEAIERVRCAEAHFLVYPFRTSSERRRGHKDAQKEKSKDICEIHSPGDPSNIAPAGG